MRPTPTTTVSQWSLADIRKAHAAHTEQQTLPISQLRREKQRRVIHELDPDHVAQLAAQLEGDHPLEPVVAFFLEKPADGQGPGYYLVDGYHRVAATEEAGRPEVACMVYTGADEETAEAYAHLANNQHGKAATHRDNAATLEYWMTRPGFEERYFPDGVPQIKLLAADTCIPETTLYRHLEDRIKASEAGKAAERVARENEIWELHTEKLSQREIATRVGLSPGQVNRIIKKWKAQQAEEELEEALRNEPQERELVQRLEEAVDSTAWALPAGYKDLREFCEQDPAGHREWYTQATKLWSIAARAFWRRVIAHGRRHNKNMVDSISDLEASGDGYEVDSAYAAAWNIEEGLFISLAKSGAKEATPPPYAPRPIKLGTSKYPPIGYTPRVYVTGKSPEEAEELKREAERAALGRFRREQERLYWEYADQREIRRPENWEKLAKPRKAPYYF